MSNPIRGTPAHDIAPTNLFVKKTLTGCGDTTMRIPRLNVCEIITRNLILSTLLAFLLIRIGNILL